MKVYAVTYWQEGPGRSDWQETFVLANTKKDAIKFVNRTHGVYKSDRVNTTAHLVPVEKQSAYQLPDTWKDA